MFLQLNLAADVASAPWGSGRMTLDQACQCVSTAPGQCEAPGECRLLPSYARRGWLPWGVPAAPSSSEPLMDTSWPLQGAYCVQTTDQALPAHPSSPSRWTPSLSVSHRGETPSSRSNTLGRAALGSELRSCDSESCHRPCCLSELVRLERPALL